jgi:hypothetical protein
MKVSVLQPLPLFSVLMEGPTYQDLTRRAVTVPPVIMETGARKSECIIIINIYKIFAACRLCAAYVKLKSPETALYKGLSSSSPNHTRYRLTYRTRYTTRVQCKEDL